jgi:hypothetical protein
MSWLRKFIADLFAADREAVLADLKHERAVIRDAIGRLEQAEARVEDRIRTMQKQMNFGVAK